MPDLERFIPDLVEATAYENRHRYALHGDLGCGKRVLDVAS